MAEQSAMYELMYIINPVLNEEQTKDIAARVQKYIRENGGDIKEVVEMGSQRLAYPIQKLHKAHYVLMNIECSTAVLEELTSAFRFNDAVIRNMVINRKEPVTETSLLAKRPEERRERPSQDDSESATDDSDAETSDDESDEDEAETAASAD